MDNFRRNAGAVLTVLSLLLFCGYNIHTSVHRFNGIIGMTKKNGSGCYCHGAIPAPSVSVWVNGPDTLMAGEQATYTITISSDSLKSAGFNVAAGNGQLGVLDSLGTYWYEDELTHSEPRFIKSRDGISWVFSYTAPNSPSMELADTIYSVANATNQDTMATEADMWNFGENFAVHIQYPTTIAEPVTISDFHLFQNYPNPFNPSTRISYFLEEQSKVSLRVYDMLGEEILTLVDAVQYAGVHEVHWTGTTQLGVPAASGTYLCALKAESNSGREFSAVRKVLFLR